MSTSTGQGRRWWAQTGTGAWSGELDRHGRVAAPSPLTAARLSADEPPRAWIEPRPGTNLSPGITRLMGRVRHVEMTTHPAKMVAAGDLDLAVMYAAGIWDLAPLIPLVNEAGGHCFDTDGGRVKHLTGDVIFTGEDTAAALTKLLAP